MKQQNKKLKIMIYYNYHKNYLYNKINKTNKINKINKINKLKLYHKLNNQKILKKEFMNRNRL